MFIAPDSSLIFHLPFYLGPGGEKKCGFGFCFGNSGSCKVGVSGLGQIGFGKNGIGNTRKSYFSVPYKYYSLGLYKK